MGCLKDQDGVKAKPGRFQCKKCGKVAKKKDKVCKPRKIKERDA